MQKGTVLVRLPKIASTGTFLLLSCYNCLAGLVADYSGLILGTVHVLSPYCTMKGRCGISNIKRLTWNVLAGAKNFVLAVWWLMDFLY